MEKNLTSSINKINSEMSEIKINLCNNDEMELNNIKDQILDKNKKIKEMKNNFLYKMIDELETILEDKNKTIEILTHQYNLINEEFRDLKNKIELKDTEFKRIQDILLKKIEKIRELESILIVKEVKITDLTEKLEIIDQKISKFIKYSSIKF